MNVNALHVGLIAAALSAPAALAAPNVAVDIAPIHSLVSRVMAGVGAPDLIVRPGASPHGYAMRPSEAEALSEADIVFQVGGGLTPLVTNSIRTLAADAVSVRLIETPGLMLLGFRDGARFKPHDDGSYGETDRGEDEIDPHIWLDPVNAAVMTDAVAATLSAADPANADAYNANAAAAKTEFEALTREVQSRLTLVAGRPFIVFHDAYHYFEARFGVEAAGAFALTDSPSPGPSRIESLRVLIEELGVVCIFSEPQFSPRLIEAVTEDLGARRAALDPLGVDLAPGPDLYPQLIRNIAAKLSDCLEE